MPGNNANSCNFVILNCLLTVNYNYLQSLETQIEDRKGLQLSSPGTDFQSQKKRTTAFSPTLRAIL